MELDSIDKFNFALECVGFIRTVSTLNPQHHKLVRGFLVAPDVIVTVYTELLWEGQSKVFQPRSFLIRSTKDKEQIQIMKGSLFYSKKFDSILPKRQQTSQIYNEQQKYFDFCFLRLVRPMNNRRFLPILMNYQTIKPSKVILIHPQSYNKMEHFYTKLTEEVARFDHGWIDYQKNFCFENSGLPIMAEIDGKPFCIGMHTNKNTGLWFSSYSIGELIDERRLKELHIVAYEFTRMLDEMKNQISNLEVVNLRNIKLSGNELSKFLFLDFTNIKVLNLENNQLQDFSIKILCSQMFPNLKEINLNNNLITMHGVSILVYSKWKSGIQYKLNAVKSDYDVNSYFLRVGETIPIMKQMSILKEREILPYLFDGTDISQALAYHAVDLFLKLPDQQYTLEQIRHESQLLKSQFVKKGLNKQDLTLTSMLLYLEQSLKKQSDIIFRRQSSLKTFLSVNILFGGMQYFRVKYQHYITHEGFGKYADFVYNSSKTEHFAEMYRKWFIRQYNIQNSEDVFVHSIREGSLFVEVSVRSPVIKICNPQDKNQKNLVERNFFGKLQLSIEDFDEQGDRQFPNIKERLCHIRGGFPYFQPVLGKRFGIRVSKLYDKSDDWLMMDNNSNQWSTAFHGIRKPIEIVPKTLTTTLFSIFSGRKQGQMLQIMGTQQYQKDDCANKNEKVGLGIYCTPHFEEALITYTDNDSEFRVVLQCRIRPQSMKIVKKRPEYWLAPKPTDIRPFGVILFTNQQQNQIRSQSLRQEKPFLYDQFEWKKYKQQYLAYVKYHNEYSK